MLGIDILLFSLIASSATTSLQLVTNLIVNDLSGAGAGLGVGLSTTVHFAYNVVSPKTVSVSKFHSLTHDASLYQPLKTYPVFSGLFGFVTLSPTFTLIDITLLPPCESKLIVFLITSSS